MYCYESFIHLWNLEWTKQSEFKSFKVQRSSSFNFVLSTTSKELCLVKSPLNVLSNNVLFSPLKIGERYCNLKCTSLSMFFSYQVRNMKILIHCSTLITNIFSYTVLRSLENTSEQGNSVQIRLGIKALKNILAAVPECKCGHV